MKRHGVGMKKTAVDTNILVRILIAEPSEQGRTGEKLLASARLYVPTTVIVESEWVIRSVMKISKARICDMMRAMLQMPEFEMENPKAVEISVGAYAAGMDFADAMHVSCLGAGDRFFTFVRDLVRRAAKQSEHGSVVLAQ